MMKVMMKMKMKIMVNDDNKEGEDDDNDDNGDSDDGKNKLFSLSRDVELAFSPATSEGALQVMKKVETAFR